MAEKENNAGEGNKTNSNKQKSREGQNKEFYSSKGFQFVLDIIDVIGGIFPGVGDVVTSILNMVIPVTAKLKGTIGFGTFFLMTFITVIDILIGLIPGLGDIADIFPSNLVNGWLLNRAIEKKESGEEKKVKKTEKKKEGNSEKKSPIMKFIKLIIILLLLAYPAYFGYTLFVTGAWKGGVVAIGETGIEEAAIKKGVTWFDYVKNPNLLFYEYYSWDEPEDIEDKPTKGIRFYGIESRRGEFQEESPIRLYGSAEIIALPDEDVVIEFGCKMDDKDLAENIKGENYNKTGEFRLYGIQGNIITVYAGRNEIVDFECILNEIELDLSSEKRGDNRKEIRTFIVKVEGTYKDFTTTTLLKVYNIQKERLDQMFDPFEGLSEPLLDSNRKMKSQCLSGCGLTKLALKTSKQPQTEIGSYSLTMGLRKEKDWYGDILKLNEVQVSFPKNFEVITCENFGGDNTLDDSDQPYFDELNKEIKKKFGTTADYTFYCDYKIIRPRVFMGFDEISVRTKYDYLVDAKKIINVIETKTTSSISIGKKVQDEGESIEEDDGGYEEAEYYEV